MKINDKIIIKVTSKRGTFYGTIDSVVTAINVSGNALKVFIDLDKLPEELLQYKTSLSSSMKFSTDDIWNEDYQYSTTVVVK